MVKNKSTKLNLGSGKDYLDDWINVDINDTHKVDVIADLSARFPFENKSVDEIKASDILEHFTKESGEEFIRESHRVLVDGGKLFIRTHNIFQIFSQFNGDPQVLIHFLYGNTEEGVSGSHKYAYTKDSLTLLLKKVGFKIVSFTENQTNFEILAKKIETRLNPLKIGVIMQSPDIGGAEVFMLSLVSNFENEGSKTYVASTEGKFLDHARKISTETYQIPMTFDIIGNYRGLIKSLLMLPLGIFYYVNLLKKFRENNVDVILMSNFSEKLLVTFLSPIFKIPIVWIEYGRLETVFKKNFYIPKILYRSLKNIPKALIVPTAVTKDGLITQAGVSLSKIRVTPLGIQKPVRFKKKNSKDFTVGSVSRLVRNKGQDILIRAFPEILKSVPSAKLLIVGDGPDKKYYEKLVKELGINESVEITGFVEDVNSYYQKFDVFVFSSVWELEGFGLVIPEAMMREIPVLAFDMGPVPEIIRNDQTGFLVESGNEDLLVKRIIYLYKNPEVRKKVATDGYKYSIENYRIEKTADRITEILYEAAIA